MPYIEILCPSAPAADKQRAATAVTDGIVRAFDVSPATVTVFFQTVASDDYAHEGRHGHDGRGMRIFVKVHAYRRSPEARRDAARHLTPALATCFRTPSADVAIYFLDRERDEVAHDGHLASDEPLAPLTT